MTNKPVHHTYLLQDFVQLFVALQVHHLSNQSIFAPTFLHLDYAVREDLSLHVFHDPLEVEVANKINYFSFLFHHLLKA